MKMSDDELQYVLRMLKDTQLKAVARAAGLSYMTVYRIAKGTNPSPRYATVHKLATYFRSK
jgi:hypothetical protein